jgi:hypothetical protein
VPGPANTVNPQDLGRVLQSLHSQLIQFQGAMTRLVGLTDKQSSSSQKLIDVHGTFERVLGSHSLIDRNILLERSTVSLTNQFQRAAQAVESLVRSASRRFSSESSRGGGTRTSDTTSSGRDRTTTRGSLTSTDELTGRLRNQRQSLSESSRRFARRSHGRREEDFAGEMLSQGSGGGRFGGGPGGGESYGSFYGSRQSQSSDRQRGRDRSRSEGRDVSVARLNGQFERTSDQLAKRFQSFNRSLSSTQRDNFFGVRDVASSGRGRTRSNRADQSDRESEAITKTTEKLTGLQAAVQRANVVFGQTQMAFGLGATAIQSFALSAMPDGMRTLVSSFELVKASVGGAFMPQILQASAYLQQFAYWLQTITPEQKQFYGSLVVGTVAILGFVSALPFLVNSLAGMAIGARGAMVGLSFLAANPAVAGVFALAAAAAAANKALNDYADRLNKQVDDEKNAGAYAAHEADKSEELKKDKAIQDPEERLKVLRQKEQEARAQEMAALQKGNSGFDEGKEAQRRRLMYHQAVEDEERVKLGYKKLDRKKLDPNGAQGPGALMDLHNTAQPRYSDLGDVRDQIQLSALNDNPIQQEIKRIQMQNLEEMQKANGHLADIAAKRGGARP